MFVLFIVTTVSIDYAKSAPNAMLPLQLTSGSVASDLFSTMDIAMMPFSTSPISVSINMKIPIGHMGLITGRSGLALKKYTCACRYCRLRLFGRFKSNFNKF